jgi:predicted lipoprotein with Yx(FWY)xxD motif
MQHRRYVIPTVAVMGVLLAACGSTSGSSTSSTSSSTSSTAAPTVTTSSSQYGEILTSASGVTYYLFTADSHDHSACTGACTQAWHPVIATHPTAGGGAKASLLGTIVLPGGKHQVTYDGHPLYTFIDDSGPHVISGEGIHSFGGVWYVVSPNGSAITGSSSSSSSATGY